MSVAEPPQFFQKPTTFAHSEHKTKFKIQQSLWNPVLDVLALASADGEVCLKRVHWKTGWKKKVSSEVCFYTKWSRTVADIGTEDAGRFSAMCWSPDGSVLAVLFESGLCHLLDVNDGMVLYTLQMPNAPYSILKWFRPESAFDWGRDFDPDEFLRADGSLVPVKCDHLRTKDSDGCRDNYKIVQGIEQFCHTKVHKQLMNTILIAGGPTDTFVGFDVYLAGCMLIKTVKIDDSFMPEASDRLSTEIRDICLLPNGQIQVALSTMSFGRPDFDPTCNFTLPEESDDQNAGSTVYLVEYDIGLTNALFMRSMVKLATRTCHVFHLLTNLRETFLKTVHDWEKQSEAFHDHIFKRLYEDYLSENRGTVADFCLDFVSYILTGQATNAFSQAFFKNVRPKQMKPAKDFVFKHIPHLINTINKHLVVTASALNVHLTALVKQLEELEQDEEDGIFEDQPSPSFSSEENSPQSKPVEQCRKARVILGILTKKLHRLVDLAGDNWAELKYMLMLLCNQPDESAEEFEADVEGALRERDFELLIKLVTNALVQPDQMESAEWFHFLNDYRDRLKGAHKSEEEPAPSRPLICNPAWLQQRTFDRIAPYLGICNDLRELPVDDDEEADTRDERAGIDGKNGANLFEEPVDMTRLTTVINSLSYLFDALEDVYKFGLTGRKSCTPGQPIPPKLHCCLEFCHPEPVTKLALMSWTDLKQVHSFMERAAADSALDRLADLEQLHPDAEFKSVVALARSSTATLQCYATANGLRENVEGSTPAKVAPTAALHISAFSSLHNCDGFGTLPMNQFMNNKFHVLDFELYGAGLLHLLATTCESEGNGSSMVYVLKVDVLGQAPITHADDPRLCIAARRAVGVLFERNFEFVKWFDLEMNSLNTMAEEDDQNIDPHTTINFSPLKVKREVKEGDSQTPTASGTETPTRPSSRPVLRQIKREPIDEEDEDEEETTRVPLDLDDLAIYVELDSPSPPATPQGLRTPRRFLSTPPIGQWHDLDPSLEGSPPQHNFAPTRSTSSNSSPDSDANSVDESPSTSPERPEEEFEDADEPEEDEGAANRATIPPLQVPPPPPPVPLAAEAVADEPARLEDMDFEEVSDQYYSFQESGPENLEDDQNEETRQQ